MLLFLAGFNFAQNVPAYVPTNGLVGWWPFSGNAIDSSGNGNNGTVNGATLTTDRNGVANRAYSFDGVNDFINTNQINFSNYQEMTISTWVNYNAILGGRIMSANNNFFDFATGSISPVNGLFYFAWNGTGAVYVDRLATQNLWVNLVVVLNSTDSSFSFYYNGVLDTLVHQPISLINSNLYFGRHFGFTQTNTFMNGKIDDIGIWNRALTSCEIADLYNGQIGSQNSSNSITTNSCSSYSLNGQTYTQSGTYTQVRTNAAGCDSTITLNLTINQPTTSTITQSACSSFSLNGQTYTQSGTYTQVRTNAAGCDSTITLNLTINQPPTASSNVSNTTFHGASDGAADLTVSGSAPFSFVWSNGATTEDLNNVAAGTYSVTISDANGCTNTTSITVNQPPLSVIQNSLKTELKVYPNPVDKVLNVELSNFNQMIGYKLRINNSLGQSVYSQELSLAQFSIDLSSWKVAGTYFVELLDQNGNKVESKIILVK